MKINFNFLLLVTLVKIQNFYLFTSHCSQKLQSFSQIWTNLVMMVWFEFEAKPQMPKNNTRFKNGQKYLYQEIIISLH